MAKRLVTVKGATVRVSPIGGLTVTGADTKAADTRLQGLLSRNNGKALRDDDDRTADRGAVLANIAALVRLAMTPMGLAEAREAHKDGTLKGAIAPRIAVSSGKTPASVNMSLDRDAKAFGADGFTIRCFDGEGDTVVLYTGKPKG